MSELEAKLPKEIRINKEMHPVRKFIHFAGDPTGLAIVKRDLYYKGNHEEYFLVQRNFEPVITTYKKSE